jgi:hypothetical protein
MPSTIRDLTELTTVATDDYVLISDTSDVTNRDKRVSITNLQTNTAKKTGTPVAGRIASWSDANTLQDGSTVAAATRLIASSAAGLTLEDDGGNVGLFIADGGVTTVAGTMFAFPVAGAVRAKGIGNLYEYSIAPGTITNTQVWTMDITLVNAGSNFSAIMDIGIVCAASANPPTAVRALYRASIAFYRAASGATATVVTPVVHLTSSVAVTVAATAIADGIRVTVTPTITINRNCATLNIACPAISPTVTSTVA